jgi:hypothetical protein
MHPVPLGRGVQATVDAKAPRTGEAWGAGKHTNINIFFFLDVKFIILVDIYTARPYYSIAQKLTLK